MQMTLPRKAYLNEQSHKHQNRSPKTWLTVQKSNRPASSHANAGLSVYLSPNIKQTIRLRFAALVRLYEAAAALQGHLD